LDGEEKRDREERGIKYALDHSVMNGRVETKACGVMVKVEEQEAAI
jgi:hypothetical protein